VKLEAFPNVISSCKHGEWINEKVLWVCSVDYNVEITLASCELTIM
jgi:hypothetical protein